MNKLYFHNSLLVSIIVQLLIGGIDIFALSIKIPTALKVIRQLLKVELGVQTIEVLFYIWLFFNVHKETNVTPKRYLDWFITTPTMLVTLIVYLIYVKNKEIGGTENLDFLSIVIENKGVITKVLLLNWLMLLYGYLTEIKVLPTVIGVTLGFIPFLLYYYLIYKNYANMSKEGWKIFMYFFIFWSLYGVVAYMSYYARNMFYNILDLFAKNFLGLFLSYLLIFKKV